MKLLRDYALQFVGVQYKWGGDDPIDGFDCSGFVQHLLRSVGVDPIGDQNAQALHDLLLSQPHTEDCKCGTLVFFGKDKQHITHVAMALDSYRMIEAGGGDHLCLTPKDAALKNAFIRISPIASRKDLVAMVRPIYKDVE